MTALGVDYSGRPPDPAHLRTAGFVLVCRYLAPRPNPKVLTAGEAKAMLSAGVDVVAVWESTANRALGGARAGQADGAAAAKQMDALGAPIGAAVYYAVDFDMQPSQAATVTLYQAGFAAGVAPRPVGCYGGLAAVTNAAAHGVRYLWQTVAWSRGRVHPDVALYQNGHSVSIDGTACDVDEVRRGDYGGWLSHPAPTPPLPPPVIGPEEPAVLIPVQFPHLPSGAGWWDCDGNPGPGDGYPRPLVHWADARGVFLNGDDDNPPPGVTTTLNPHGGLVRVGVSGLPKNAAPLVWLQVATGS